MIVWPAANKFPFDEECTHNKSKSEIYNFLSLTSLQKVKSETYKKPTLQSTLIKVKGFFLPKKSKQNSPLKQSFCFL